jgi:hypothetical protein
MVFLISEALNLYVRAEGGSVFAFRRGRLECCDMSLEGIVCTFVDGTFTAKPF